MNGGVVSRNSQTLGRRRLHLNQLALCILPRSFQPSNGSSKLGAHTTHMKIESDHEVAMRLSQGAHSSIRQRAARKVRNTLQLLPQPATATVRPYPAKKTYILACIPIHTFPACVCPRATECARACAFFCK